MLNNNENINNRANDNTKDEGVQHVSTNTDETVSTLPNFIGVNNAWVCCICRSSDYVPIMITVCGHTLCEDCSTKIKDCPFCKKRFSQYDMQTNYALISPNQRGIKRKRSGDNNYDDKINKSIREAKRKFAVLLDDDLSSSVTKINSHIESMTARTLRVWLTMRQENVHRIIDIYKKHNIKITQLSNKCSYEILIPSLL